MKKTATLEQLREYRELTQNMNIDSDFEKINKFVEEYDTMCQVYEENGKEGVKDILGEVLVPAVFDCIAMTFEDVYRGLVIPVVKDGKFALVRPDGAGTLASEFIFDDIHFYEWFYYTVKDGKYGLYTNGGHEVLPPVADKVFEPFNDLVAYQVGDKFGFTMLGLGSYTEAIFEDYNPDDDGRLSVVLDGKKGYLDEDAQFTEDRDEAYFHAECI